MPISYVLFTSCLVLVASWLLSRRMLRSPATLAKQRRTPVMTSIVFLCSAAFGVYAFYITWQCLDAGVVAVGKYVHRAVSLEADPGRFWLEIGLRYLVGMVMTCIPVASALTRIA